MRSILLLVAICVVLCIFTPVGGTVLHYIDYWCGYSAGQEEVEEAKQKAFGRLGLWFQRDFVGIHSHEEKSQSWNEGHSQAILDALAPSP